MTVGADTVEEAVKLHKESKEIFQRASMNHRKWTPNEENLSKILDGPEKDTAHKVNPIERGHSNTGYEMETLRSHVCRRRFYWK